MVDPLIDIQPGMWSSQYLHVPPSVEKLTEPAKHQSEILTGQPMEYPEGSVDDSCMLRFLINASIDEKKGEIDLMAFVYGVEVLEKKTNAVTCPKTGRQLEFRHFIADPETKKVWDPAISAEVDRLLNTKTIRFIKRREIP